MVAVMGRKTEDKRSQAIAALSDKGRRTLRLRANGELYLRATAVIQQAQRLRASGQPGAEYMADMWLFSHALRGALKFGEFCFELSDESEGEGLRPVIEEFRAVVPDAVLLRDVLEHFDDYLLGIGRNQKLVSNPTFFYERGETARIHVGGMVIDVDAAEKASIRLATIAIVGPDEPPEEPDQ